MRRRRLRDLLLPPLVGLAGPALVRALAATWRLRIVGEPPRPRSERKDRTPRVYCVWHDSLLASLVTGRGCGIVALVSRHGDGELIARVLEGLGFRTVRGSSTRGGAAAALGLVEAAKEGDVAITPDGPRGPARRAKPGALFVAARAGARLVPVAAAASSEWRFGSWDRFRVPRPFSRVVVAFGPPIDPPEDVSDGALDQAAARLTDRLRATEEAARRALEESG